MKRTIALRIFTLGLFILFMLSGVISIAAAQTNNLIHSKKSNKFMEFMFEGKMKLDMPIDVDLKFLYSQFDNRPLLGNLIAHNTHDRSVYYHVYIALYDAEKKLVAVGSFLGSDKLPLEPGAGKYDVTSFSFGITEEQTKNIKFYQIASYVWEIPPK